jgi:iron complex outermembrane recepter protein
MKRIAFFNLLLLAALVAQAQQPVGPDSFYRLSPVEVRAVRAADRAPVAKTNLTSKDIQKQNLGQDLPFLLNQTPSVVVNSDAGNGVGYTGIRIRGTDATRINVTLNGIPYNDAESQGTFFVDLPDFASSVNSIQVQRGVGTSTSGAGAFGATINFSTNEINQKAYTEFNNSFGTFNTWKNTLKLGTGLMGGHFTADLRLSSLSSDGYIDRASSRLRSLYFSTAYVGVRNTLRLTVLKGYEKTYQAWYGVSEEDQRAGRRTINYAGTEKPGDPYPNETDNYWQDHYQLFYTHHFNSHLDFNTASFLTHGRGYYEEYRAGQLYSDYQLMPAIVGIDSFYSTDLVRQLWLRNNFYGNIFSLQYRNSGTEVTVGGGYTRYDGVHYGILTWMEHGLTGPDKWYDVDAFKTDANGYVKLLRKLSRDWSGYLDLQYRHVGYDINGFDDNPVLLVHNNYDFFNPKAGLSYSRNNWSGYLSGSVASKEPNRDDFEASQLQLPRPERLHDLEFGIARKQAHSNISVGFYYMKYKDQLVLTGKINDVGAYTRTNIPDSYRAGIELQAGVQPVQWLSATGNFTLSRNEVKQFTEYIDDYDNGGQKLNRYSSTDIALSPNSIGAATVSFLPWQFLTIDLVGKYVGRQYLDNTSNPERTLQPYYVQDARLSYQFHHHMLKEARVILQVNNVFNRKYEPSGYTYNYISGGVLSVNNYYFPMAGTNFMAAVNLRF